MIPELIFEEIEISKNKLVGYLLNSNHSIGMHKAVFFNNLGFFAENWETLKDGLLNHLKSATEFEEIINQFGKKIVIINDLKGLNKQIVKIKSIWFIENHEKILKFVTAYPEK